MVVGGNLGVVINAPLLPVIRRRGGVSRPGHNTTALSGRRQQAGPGLGQPLSSHIHPETPAAGHKPPSVSDEAATMTRTAEARILADGWQATCFPPSTTECPRRPPEAHLQGVVVGWRGQEPGEGLEKFDPPTTAAGPKRPT